jgi:hypothetical protein
MVKAIQLEYLLRFYTVFLVKVTRNRGKSTTWVCPLGAVGLAVIYLTLMTLKTKSLRSLKISSAGVAGER